MASGTHYEQEYHRAEGAYLQGNYQQAAQIVDHLAEESPEDPSVLLLRGHIYCCLQQYDFACQQYERVLEVTDEEEFVNYANKGIKDAKAWATQDLPNEQEPYSRLEPDAQAPEFLESDRQLFTAPPKNLASWAREESPSSEEEEALGVEELFNNSTEPLEDTDSPFAAFDESQLSQGVGIDEPFHNREAGDSQTLLTPSGPLGAELPKASEAQNEEAYEQEGDYPDYGEYDDPETLLMSSEELEDTFGHNSKTATEQTSDFSAPLDPWQETTYQEDEIELEQEQWLHEAGDESMETKQWGVSSSASRRQEPEMPAFAEEDFPSVETTGYNSGVDSIADFDLAEVESGSFSEERLESGVGLNGQQEEQQRVISEESPIRARGGNQRQGKVARVESEGSSTELEPVVESKQGVWSALYNAPLRRKNFLIASTAGVVSALTVAISSAMIPAGTGEGEPGVVARVGRTGGLMAITSVCSFGATFLVGRFALRQIKRTTEDLQGQFYAVQQGNLNAKATVFSKDELGQLATGFNQMTQAISTITSEAQRKAEEQEQAKEDLQRQVIRLLDDVEGAARGDLTVQAEVSADVLGAVADAFNLTIRNLRMIVQQVKEAARQVNQSSTESESFARGLSEDALRQAEELAVTLNSVQMMTDSIQRVAENAQEAEKVARSASETALKGGEAVDSTVAGILQIRETVAQTARKVKRLAESSQEISKIVSAISQIASRTNLLALNASIVAAKAGDAGREFAVIADEVRQLADRSAKSLKEIEKIVLQIQSETGSVMTAMEEGTQQVIEGTQRAEQAKRALEDIIQVSNRIDTLVRSITADTVEQTKTSRSVAQVMQSVEMTAQGTSQESQQVSNALQNLVSLAGDLLASVERFRVDPAERN